VTTPDYREQAIPKDVWDAISRYTNEATSGMPLHEQLEARKERIRLTLASWASRIAEEERERCAKVADHESLFWARALNPPASLGCGGVAERIRAGARSLLGEEGT
jgi:uncharacterized membrane-anchored protein